MEGGSVQTSANKCCKSNVLDTITWCLKSEEDKIRIRCFGHFKHLRIHIEFVVRGHSPDIFRSSMVGLWSINLSDLDACQSQLCHRGFLIPEVYQTATTCSLMTAYSHLRFSILTFSHAWPSKRTKRATGEELLNVSLWKNGVFHFKFCNLFPPRKGSGTCHVAGLLQTERH